jgi:hypothetical protein
MAKTNAKLPKKIAGVKIPKKLRKSGNKLIEVANTPAGRELLAAGLVAAGTALARAQKRRPPIEAATAEPEIDPAERGAQMAGQIGAAMGAAANAALDRLFGTEGAAKAGDAPSPAGKRTH